MKIAIPSKERPCNLPTVDLFGKFFSQIYIFVEPQDVAAYQEANPHCRIIRMEKSHRGLAYARNQIIDYFQGESVLELDDDIFDIFKRDRITKKLKSIKNSGEEMQAMMDAMDGAIAKGYKLVAISYAPSNWYEQKSFKINGRARVTIGIDTTCNLRFDENCLCCADYDFAAQIIQNNFKSIILYDWAFENRPMTTGTGGCQSADLMPRKERTLATYKYLLAKWGPNIVKAQKSKKLPLEIQFYWHKIGK